MTKTHGGPRAFRCKSCKQALAPRQAATSTMNGDRAFYRCPFCRHAGWTKHPMVVACARGIQP